MRRKLQTAKAETQSVDFAHSLPGLRVSQVCLHSQEVYDERWKRSCKGK